LQRKRLPQFGEYKSVDIPTDQMGNCEYSLIGPTKWDKMILYNVCQREERLLNIVVNNVKDKSKQISMHFSNVKPRTLTKYSHLFHGINKLHFTGSDSSSFRSVSFDIFQHIRCFTLEKCYLYSSLNVDWKHLVQLELIKCGFDSIEHLNSTQTLKELKIRDHANHISISCSLDNVYYIEISSIFFTVEMIFPKNCQDFLLSVFSAELKYNAEDDAEINSTKRENESLKRLMINCSLDLNFDSRLPDYWKLYSIIEMKSRQRNQNFLSLPVPRGRKISLTRFNLSFWSGNTLLNMKELYLDQIQNLDNLPDMPQVESVFLRSVASFRIISGFPNMKVLTVEDCESLERIFCCPALQELQVSYCENIKEVSFCARVKTLTPGNQESLIHWIRIDGNENSFRNDKKLVNIRELPLVRDFSFCQYIHHVELNALSGFASCEGISNIHNLKIIKCRAITSTRGLRNIFAKLELRHCKCLKSLLDVQNIPEVEIGYCTELVDFNGLGHNQIVKICDPRTVLSFEKFQKENPAIVETIQQLVMNK
jgi:hypothetical protein